MKTQPNTSFSRRQNSAPGGLGGYAVVLLAVASLVAWERAQADMLDVSSVNRDKVYRIDTNGTVTAFATINLLPEGLAFGTNGRLYVANDGGNWVNRVTTSGVVSVFVTNIAQPYGLAFDSKGNLYAASQGTMVTHQSPFAMA